MNLLTEALILLVLFNGFEYSMTDLLDEEEGCDKAVSEKITSFVYCTADKYGLPKNFISKGDLYDNQTCCGFYEYHCAKAQMVSTLCKPKPTFFVTIDKFYEIYTAGCQTNGQICGKLVKNECKLYDKEYNDCKTFQWKPSDTSNKRFFEATGCPKEWVTKTFGNSANCLEKKMKRVGKSNRDVLECCKQYQVMCIGIQTVKKSCKPQTFFHQLVEMAYQEFTKKCENSLPTKELCAEFNRKVDQKTCGVIDTYSECNSYSWMRSSVSKRDGSVDDSSTPVMVTSKPTTSGTLTSFSADDSSTPAIDTPKSTTSKTLASFSVDDSSTQSADTTKATTSGTFTPFSEMESLVLCLSLFTTALILIS